MSIKLEKYICVCHKCNNYVSLYAENIETIPESMPCECGEIRFSIPSGEELLAIVT